ncbi:hypothetical protein VTJ49DRAFT_6765 [Mycothermus thermophilus]|uniref:Clr5 domain-containing protein n=1 Tax=Humicola insolens TaxID=85995 RepID=A0ABR3VII8_HUMIN
MTKQWDKYREIIVAEYKHLNKPLREVQRVMSQRYGFRASTRAYRSRFDRWGIHKYSRRRRLRDMSMMRRHGSDSDDGDGDIDIDADVTQHFPPSPPSPRDSPSPGSEEHEHHSPHSQSSVRNSSTLSVLAAPAGGMLTPPMSLGAASVSGGYSRSSLSLVKPEFPFSPTTPSTSPVVGHDAGYSSLSHHHFGGGAYQSYSHHQGCYSSGALAGYRQAHFRDIAVSPTGSDPEHGGLSSSSVHGLHAGYGYSLGLGL